MCNDCGTIFTQSLTADQVDAEPPDCPRCSGVTQQEFVPIAVHGSKAVVRSDARKMAETIAAEDYGVADMNINKGDVAKVRYKDNSHITAGGANWIGPNSEMLQGALREGRAMREQFGSGLDVLQGNLQNGTQVDLIEASKRRSMRVWSVIPAMLVAGSLSLLFFQGMQLVYAIC